MIRKILIQLFQDKYRVYSSNMFQYNLKNTIWWPLNGDLKKLSLQENSMYTLQRLEKLQQPKYVYSTQGKATILWRNIFQLTDLKDLLMRRRYTLYYPVTLKATVRQYNQINISFETRSENESNFKERSKERHLLWKSHISERHLMFMAEHS